MNKYDDEVLAYFAGLPRLGDMMRSQGFYASAYALLLFGMMEKNYKVTEFGFKYLESIGYDI